MLQKSIAIFCLLFLFQTLQAQAPASYSSSDIYQGLKKLNVLGSVLYIAAHPDDENTRLLSYLSKEKMVRTGYLSLTRGDGGQNLIGEEQGIELGLIRTQELLAARRIDGAEQFFTRAFDFGYSKNPEETFEKWDKEKVLADMVWVIRTFKPQVIITRFPETGEGGHGHHTASAILAKEAFHAAADPKRFPEQLAYTSTWQVTRLLWNTFNFGGNNTIRDDQFKMDVGQYNALLGKSYGEIAAESRSQHKSQGFGIAAGRGEAFEYFSTTLGREPRQDLFDDITTNWASIPGGANITKQVNSLVSTYDINHPAKSIPGLIQLYKAVEHTGNAYWKTQKLKEIKNLLRQAAGLWVDAYTNTAFAVPMDSLRFNIAINDRTGSNVLVKKVSVNGFDTVLNQSLAANRNVFLAKTLQVPANKSISQPYWLALPKAEGYYQVAQQQMIGQPDASAAYTVKVSFAINGLDLDYSVPVRYKYTDPVQGEVYEPLIIVPPLTAIADEPIKISRDQNNFSGVIKFTAHKDNVGEMPLQAITGKDVNAKQQLSPANLSLQKKNQSAEVAYQVKGQKDNDYVFTYKVGNGNDDTVLKWHTIRYAHIPPIHYFEPVTVSNRMLDLKIAGTHIGYITGAGDKVPEALLQMGYQVSILGEKELALNNLQKFDAIIAGVRAYNTNDWLNNHYARLMEYIENGGNLIVQYNTNNNLGGIRASIGPYPFSISRVRITNEQSPVKFKEPAHPVFNFPNKINAKDFEGWVQERSLYHAGERDERLQSVLLMNDPGEKEEDGSLLIGRYGKGVFVYTGISFFRQLPAGVPGAYRLLANLIALNKTSSK